MIFVLFAIFLMIYYLFLFITSSQKDKLANLTTILSFVVGFLAIKYQINNDFMKKEEENILEITHQLDFIQRKGLHIELNTNFFEEYYVSDNDITKKLRHLKSIEKVIREQMENCYNIDKLIIENRNTIIPKISYFKMSVLDKLLKSSHANIKNYIENLSNMSGALFIIEDELHHIESIKNYDKSYSNSNRKNLKYANKHLKSSLKAENDKELLYSFLQKYDK